MKPNSSHDITSRVVPVQEQDCAGHDDQEEHDPHPEASVLPHGLTDLETSKKQI